jgi:integrase
MADLAPTDRKVAFAKVSTIFTAAVDDELIPKNPCKAASVRRPWPDPKKLVPWTRERVLAVRNELPERYHLVVWLGAGLWFAPGRDLRSLPRRHRLPGGRGSRPAAGQAVRRERSGLRTAEGAQGSAARRRPGDHHVVHDRAPAGRITLPWNVRDGKPTTVSLLRTSREKKALNRNYFNTFIWRPALQRVGVPDERENGCHALRHFYASTALHEGETIKAVSEYLSHADPGFTLRTYGTSWRVAPNAPSGRSTPRSAGVRRPMRPHLMKNQRDYLISRASR